MSDESFIREVDEEVRQEQLQKLLSKYGRYIITAAVIVVATVAGVKGWQAWNKNQTQKSGARFEAANRLVSEGKTDEARKKLAELAKSGYGGYDELARLRLAALDGKAKTRDIVAAFDAFAKDTSHDETLRQLARIRAATLRLDEADEAEMTERLSGLGDDMSPWRHSARELLGLAAWKAKKYKKADGFFKQILSDPAAPRDIRARAGQMRALIKPKLAAT